MIIKKMIDNNAMKVNCEFESLKQQVTSWYSINEFISNNEKFKLFETSNEYHEWTHVEMIIRYIEFLIWKEKRILNENR